ncbi:molybdopterin oxidoreductase family protein [Gryllotalpicola reticulitermitis]|uniref:Molybdopterin oxidoreductase family protein n=1 Tax=Gryllotalpicola reticulitermitis TaxID=1184153 RepID=A0ABV8Q6R7_9MICO
MSDTHCPYCALQCAMRLTPVTAGSDDGFDKLNHRAAPVTVSPREFPTNRGGLCRKGWTSAELLARPGRVVHPLIRQPDGSFAEAAWDAALELIAERLRAARATFGPDAVAVFGGGGLTNEKAYQLGKFARLALGTSRIDYNGRYCMSSAAAAGNRAFGLDRGLPFRVTDLDEARTIMLIGSNPADTMPPFTRHLEGAREAGGLIVVDPRQTTTAKLTQDGAGIHLQPAPGTDLVLLLGLTHLVIAEDLVDRAFIDARTEGFAALRRSVSQWWPERVASVTGVPVELQRRVARRLAEGGAYLLTGRGVEQHVDGTDTATAAINLALVLGLVGSADGGYGTMTGQGNGQGGREHGQKADQLPGYRKITDLAARAHVAAVWGVEPETLPGPGIPATELLGLLGRPGARGGVRCLLVHGSNLLVSSPDVNAVRAGLAGLDLLVVCDFVFNETAALADVVLPVPQWAEEEGTMTNLEGRVLRRQAAIAPPAEARSELWIMAELARRLDAPSTWPTDPAVVFDELALASAGGIADYSGLSHARLDAQLAAGRAAYWPFAAGATDESEGTPRLFADGFAHPDGRARLVAVKVRSEIADVPAGPADDELTLITGRLLGHYQSGAQTRLVPELLEAAPEALLEIHPATAARLGLGDGAAVELSNEHGRVECRVVFAPGIRPDTVFLPFHFAGDESVNRLVAAACDPISGMPEFKRSRVRVRALTGEAATA